MSDQELVGSFPTVKRRRKKRGSSKGNGRGGDTGSGEARGGEAQKSGGGPRSPRHVQDPTNGPTRRAKKQPTSVVDMFALQEMDIVGSKEQYTPVQIGEALEANGGWVTKTARALGCGYSTLQTYFEKYPVLRDIAKALREGYTDLAEEQLLQKIRDGNLTAIIFWLKCQGKARGWVERTELGGVADQPIVINVIPVASDDNVVDVTPESASEPRGDGVDAEKTVNVKT